MALARWQATIVDEAGNVQDGASIEVRREVSGSPLASVFSDRDGATPLGNPFTVGSDGFAAFHAAGGAYRITATLGAFSRVWRYVAIGTAGEADADSFVSGPSGNVVAGQLAVFGDTSGAVIEGADDGGSPVTPLTAASILDASALPDAGEAQRGVLDKATDAEIRAAASGAHAICAEDLASASAFVALSDAATVTWDWTAGINFSLTVAGNRTIGSPSNPVVGQWRTILVQGSDATDRTLAFHSDFTGEVPSLTDIDSTHYYLLTIFCRAAGGSPRFAVSAKNARDA